MSNKKNVVILIVLVIVGVAVVAANAKHNENMSQDNSTQPDYSTTASDDALTSKEQARCLDDASNKYSSDWKAADKDGDGKVAYTDGATNITTSYYDAQITCYQVWKTDDGQGYITDLQAKRQQEVDTYNTWVSSLSPTYTAPSSPTPTHCTSYSYGVDDRYTSTNCY